MQWIQKFYYFIDERLDGLEKPHSGTKQAEHTLGRAAQAALSGWPRYLPSVVPDWIKCRGRYISEIQRIS